MGLLGTTPPTLTPPKTQPGVNPNAPLPTTPVTPFGQNATLGTTGAIVPTQPTTFAPNATLGTPGTAVTPPIGWAPPGSAIVPNQPTTQLPALPSTTTPTTPTTPATPKYDTTSLAGLQSAADAYFQSHPVGDLPALVTYLQGLGFNVQQATHAGGLPSDDKILFNGEVIDTMSDAGGADSQWQWLVEDPNAPNTDSTTATNITAPTTSPTTSIGSISAGAAPTASGGMNDAMNAAIMQLLDTPQNVDAASLQSDPETQAFNIAASRSTDAQEAALAERAAAEGWNNSGAESAQSQGLKQAQGESEAQFVGQLANTKLQQQHDALVQGIQYAMATGQFQMAQQLQLQLANIQAALQQAQLAQQQNQFEQNLGYNYTALGVDANQAAAQALLNG